MSRKLLVPFQLPANPTLALEAVTKQYCDLQNEVIVSATDPIGANPQAELWIDTTTVAPNFSAGQITNVPVGNITATDVQSAINQLPRGHIASVNNSGGNISCPVNTLTYLTTAMAVTLLTGRRYRLQWSFRAVGRTDASDAAGIYTNMTLYDNVTALSGATWVDFWHMYRGNWSNLTGFVYVVGDGVARSLRLGIGGATSPAAALTIYPTWFGIEDVGT
jgi:hypothetical protein